MDLLDELLAQLHDHPEEPALLSMCVDELLEQTTADRDQAEHHCRTVASAAVQARQLAEATDLCRQDTPSGRWLFRRIRQLVAAPRSGPVLLVVIPGTEAFGSCKPRPQRNGAPGYTILATAPWVLLLWAQELDRRAEQQRVRRAHRKRQQ